MQRLSLILSVLIAGLVAGATPEVAAESTLAFIHVDVIDATGTPAQPDMTVVIRGQRIVEVAKSGQAQVPANAQVVEARGKYLIPGLWDMCPCG